MDKHEELAKWYLRLNGYFLVDNFIVHAGDDNTKINDTGLVSQHTECDLLGVRFPYQKETSGKLNISNDNQLIISQRDTIDCVVVEVKSGKRNQPNSAWVDKGKLHAIEYVVRFFGLLPNEDLIKQVSLELSNCYLSKINNIAFRYIIISYERNDHYSRKGVKYILFEDIIRFIKEVRVECWLNENIGVHSYKQQWGEFINKIFDLAGSNYGSEEADDLIKKYLKE